MRRTTTPPTAEPTDRIRAIDYQIGNLLARLDPNPAHSKMLRLTGVALSSRAGDGDACLDIERFAGMPIHPDSATDLILPEYKVWKYVLHQSSIVGDGSVPTPLVYTADGLLYFYRYWLAEKRIADWVEERLGRPVVGPSAEESALFTALFPDRGEDQTDWQAEAARAATTGSFTFIAGGPGTGKTTVVARILALLIERNPALRVILAAPTGKAANRLASAVQSESRGEAIPERLAGLIPTEAQTIHRMLGYRPDMDMFSRNAKRPIDADVVVIDEASMVDLTLFDALLAAIPAETKLIMLGDKDQLSSVEVGYVFADLSKTLLASQVQLRSNVDVHAPRTLSQPAIELTKNWRFASGSGIGRLASAIRAGNAVEALDLLDDDTFDDVVLRSTLDNTRAIVDLLGAELGTYMRSSSTAEALDTIKKGQFLCGTHAGPRGVDAINYSVNRKLGISAGKESDALFDLCPVLVTSNDYSVDLFNGDVGVCRREGDQLMVWFPDGSGDIRPVAPSRMPSYRIAWAMTVHKSQGSEYKHVVLVLPTDLSPILTRELLYTGVTRARKKIEIIGSPGTIQRAINQTTERVSGLRRRLGVKRR